MHAYLHLEMDFRFVYYNYEFSNILIVSLSIIIIIMAKNKKYSVIDDETLENMKRYYRIENHDELLRYMKKNSILKGDNEHNERRH